MAKKEHLILPYIALSMGALLWASSFVALKIAFRAYHPMVVIFGRMVIGSLCFLLMSRSFKTLSFTLIHFKNLRRDVGLVVVMVVCEPCLSFIFEAKAVELTTTSQAGLITSMLPLMVSLVAFFVLKEPLTQRTLAGLMISVFGAGWLSLSANASMDAPNPPLGNLLGIIAMVCSAGYTVCLKRLTEKGHSPLFPHRTSGPLPGRCFIFSLYCCPPSPCPPLFR